MSGKTTSRQVPDPLVTDAEFLHKQSLERDRANRTNTKPDLSIGKVWVEERAATRIGGLAFIRRKLGHHEKAAEWFKNAYEALYGGMAPAIDMGKVRVDTSIMAHDNGAVARLDQGRELLDMIVGTQTRPPHLPKPATDRIISCVVFGDPAGRLAPVGASGKPSGRAIEREVDRLLEALDLVAEMRGYKMRGAA